MVEEFAALGADDAGAGCRRGIRFHARRLDGGTPDPGAGGLEDGVLPPHEGDA